MTLRRLLLRLMRADRAAVVTLAGLVAVTAFLAAAAPLAVLRMDDEALRASLADLPPGARGVTASLHSVQPVEGSAFSTSEMGTDVRTFDRVRANLTGRLGPTLGSVVTTRSYFAHLRPALTEPLISYRKYEIAFGLRVQSDYGSQVRFVQGRAPGAPEPAGSVPAELEVAISAANARAAGLRAGQPLVLAASSRSPSVRVRIAGVYEPVDRSQPDWLAEPSLTEPELTSDEGPPPPDPSDYWKVSLLVAPEALPALVALDRTLYEKPDGRVGWRFWPDPDRLDGGHTAALESDLSAFTTTAPHNVMVTVDTALPGMLATYRRQQATTHAVVSLAVSGLLLVAAAVLALAARLTAERRRATLELFRARGGSARQLAALFAAETAAVAAVAGGAGLAAALMLLPGRGGLAAAELAVAVVAAVVIGVPALAVREYQAIGRAVRRDVVRHRPSLPRLTGEVLVVLLAGVAVVELRRRGLSESATAGVDPLLVSVPVLVGLAVALLALRCYPVPLRLLGDLAARRRAAVPFLGLARAARESPVSALPLVVLLTALSLGVFADAVWVTVHRGQQVAAWENTQADARVGGLVDVPLPPAAVERLDRLPGVDSVVAGFTDGHSSLRVAGGIATVRAVVPDLAGYDRLLRSSPSGFRFPAAMSAPVSRGADVPALVSPALDRRLAGPGGTGARSGVRLWLSSGELTVRVVGTTAGMPGAPADNLVVMGRDAVAAATGADRPPTVLWLGGRDLEPASVRAAVADLNPVPVVVTRAETHAAIRDQPLVRGTLLAFPAAAVVAAGFGLITVRLALLVTARPRDRMLAYLRALGLTPRQARGLAVLEFLPVVVLAALFGTLVGIALPYLVSPAVGLGPFTGGGRDPAVRIDPVVTGAVAVGLVAVVVAALLYETAREGRRRLAGVLRSGEED
jgi:putative ABC transport system permease protein